MSHHLTKAQKEVLQYIEEALQKKGLSPSYREIMRDLKYKSPGAIYRLIRALKEKGYLIQSSHHSWRSFFPSSSKNPDLSDLYSERGSPSNSNSSEKDFLEIIGTVSGSKPPELMMDPKTVAFHRKAFSHIVEKEQSLYGLIIQDSSFLSEYLLPGDIIIIEPTDKDIKPGEMVLATTSHESLIGHFFEEQEGMIRFKSNPYSNAGLFHEPKKRGVTDTQIWGVIHGTLRGFSPH